MQHWTPTGSPVTTRGTLGRRGTAGTAGLAALAMLAVVACSSGDPDAAATADGASRSATEVPVTDPTRAPAPEPPTTTAPVSTTTVVPESTTTTASVAPSGFVVPPTRRTELEQAGLGWLLDVEYPAQPPDVAWPTSAWPTGPLPDGIDSAAVQQIVDEAFRPVADDAGNSVGKVDALLAVSGGRLVLEAYNGWEPNEPHASWSMAKSVTQALMGVLVAEGRLDPFAPAPVPEWSDPADPRHGITVDALLHMRSGLTRQEEYAGESDVTTVLFGEGRADRGHYASSKIASRRARHDVLILDGNGPDPVADHC